jgi:phenylacetic acid degradation operon negative regulatory protein
MIVVAPVRDRARRERLRAGLGYLGYAAIGEASWISPRPSPELEPLLRAERVRAERFTAHYDGDPAGLLARAWDLDGLAHAYTGWLTEAAGLVAGLGPDAPDEQVFAVRSKLVHEWRKFLFTDPGLPAALLPVQWPGRQAAALFEAESARLLPAAAAFVDSCLKPHGTGAGRPSAHK